MTQKIYSESFYKNQISGSYLSALQYAKHLGNFFSPKSVADLGCGRGTWLKAFGECGAKDLVGFDGHWNNQEQMIDQSIKYISTDLNKPLDNQKKRFDLAISLEVAEHLKEEASTTFVHNLVNLSDVIMFSAAYKNQGGTNHINEQTNTFWAKIFIDNNYAPYDMFRPAMWGMSNVEWWYQQNTFLYVKKTSRFNEILGKAGYTPISNIEFMNCIHPHMNDSLINRLGLKFIIKNRLIKMIPKSLRPFVTNLKNRLIKIRSRQAY